MKLAEISIKRPTLIVVLFAILMLGGIFSYTKLGYELIPKFEVNVITISTVYPGASPSEIENTVTKKVEDAISSLENVKKIISQAYESISVVMIELNTGANADFAMNEAQRKVNAILADLPDDADPPSLVKFSMDDLPIITIAATGDMDEVEFFDLLDKKIQPTLSRVEGVAQVNLIGGEEREIQVNINQQKLEGFGLSVPEIRQAVMASNLDFPTGNVKTRENTTLIRLAGKYKDVQELQNLIIKETNGIQIRLKDVAEVRDTQKEVEKLARNNQESAILIQVLKQSDANAVAVSELVRQTVQEIETDYAANNVKLNIANDTSEFTLTIT